MVWDEHALYVAARLEDAALFANQTLHDSIVYHDANFEVRGRWLTSRRAALWTRPCHGAARQAHQ